MAGWSVEVLVMIRHTPLIYSWDSASWNTTVNLFCLGNLEMYLERLQLLK